MKIGQIGGLTRYQLRSILSVSNTRKEGCHPDYQSERQTLSTEIYNANRDRCCNQVLLQHFSSP